ncbi:MAG: hypothetical protein ACRYHA_16545 [Janthinobacterium lividum]
MAMTKAKAKAKAAVAVGAAAMAVAAAGAAGAANRAGRDTVAGPRKIAWTRRYLLGRRADSVRWHGAHLGSAVGWTDDRIERPARAGGDALSGGVANADPAGAAGGVPSA